MKIFKRILIGLGTLVLVFIVFAFWYRFTYSMEKVVSYEINDSSLEKRLLIATQGSAYKNDLVEYVVDSIRSKEVYIQVIDISQLEEYYNDSWDALLVIHTWEYGKPPEAVNSFVTQHYDLDKMLFLATSGSGEEKIEGIDAITGASKKDEIETHRSAILSFVRQKMDSENN